MTSLKSSRFKHNSPYSFKSALSAGAFPALLYAVFMFAVFPVMNLTGLLDEKTRFLRNTLETASKTVSGAYYYGEEEQEFTSLAEKYVYSLFSGGEEMMIFVVIATIGASILMGISLFRFITAKKTVNVYYSLGIKRTNLFLSRYAAGLVMLFVCVALPIALSAVVSTALIGFSSQLILATLYTILSVFSLAALTYSVTSAVFSAVGTSFEGAGFTAVVMLIPTAFFYCLESFGSRLLYGNPINAGYFQLGDGYYESIDMVYKYGLFNPILYLVKLFDSENIGYGELRVEVLDKLKELKMDFAQDMHFFVPIAWTAVAVVATLIGIAVFNRRRAEICGFVGMSRVLNFLASFIIGFGAFTVIIYALPEEKFVLAAVLGFAAMIVIYLVFNLIITRAPKKVFKTAYLLGAQMLTVGIILAIFASGGFGYSSKMPKAEDIEEAYVSGVNIDTVLTGDDSYAYSHYYGSEGNEAVYTNYLENSAFGPYTSKNDISKITRLHSKLIELGSAEPDSNQIFNTHIIIYYTLKDGKTFVRYYERADLEALHMCIDMYNSDFYDEKLEETFFGKIEGSPDPIVSYSGSKVIAVGSSVKTDAFRYMDLSEEQYDSLKRAIANDLKGMTAQQLLYPEKPSIGAIVFAPLDWLGMEYDYNGQLTQGELMPEEELNHNVFMADCSTSQITVFLTADMAETLAFLEQNGLMGYFHSTSADEVESITFRPAVIDRNEDFYGFVNYTLNFYAKNREANRDYYHYYDTQSKYPEGERLIDQNRITNKTKIAEVLSKAHLYYYTDNEGFVCYITYTNGETVEKYLPLDDAPDYVKNYTYRLSENESESSYSYQN